MTKQEEIKNWLIEKGTDPQTAFSRSHRPRWERIWKQNLANSIPKQCKTCMHSHSGESKREILLGI